VSRYAAVDAAVVFGSGLAVVPDGARVEWEAAYAELGWPAGDVVGHEQKLIAVRLAGGRGALRLLLACGRPHLYEGWRPRELARPVDDMARWGVRRLVLTNAAGALGRRAPGEAVVVEEVIDLQRRVDEAPARLTATPPDRSAAVSAAVQPWLRAIPGRYVAVPGPHYETPAEAEWLAGLADAVGMSTAPEARAARRNRQELLVLALLVNRASAASSHREVLGKSAAMAAGLGCALPVAIAARWPELARG
jgi:purine-nucleoside phosphorylase